MSKIRVVGVAQAFKETHPLDVVARALSAGIREAGAEGVVVAGSDGGDGLMEALGAALVRRTTHRVAGPLFAPVDVEAGWLDASTAVIESRLVCGIALVPPERRNPLGTTTRGVGELILQLCADGAEEIYVGLGGSATMDGGLGMARAWGWMPRDGQGGELPEAGGALAELGSLTAGRRPAARLVGLADVRNPLTGARGARVFARQKGASPSDTERLERGLLRLVEIAAVDGPADVARQAGAGAAGGLGFGIVYFGGGRITPGARWVLARSRFASCVVGADLVVCCEGAFDATSLEGKLAGDVLAWADEAGVPAVLVAPSAEAVPAGVVVETGGGHWTAEELARRIAIAIRRALRSPPAA